NSVPDGVGDGSAICDRGDSTRGEAAAAPVPPVGPPVLVPPVDVPVVPSMRAPCKFGSVHSKFALAETCGRTCARTWMITPLVRLISCSAFRRVGLRCSAIRIAWSSVKVGTLPADLVSLLELVSLPAKLDGPRTLNIAKIPRERKIFLIVVRRLDERQPPCGSNARYLIAIR